MPSPNKKPRSSGETRASLVATSASSSRQIGSASAMRSMRRSFHAGGAQAFAQPIELVAVAFSARGVATDRLPDLRGARRALHGARGFMEIEARGVEGQVAEF